VELASGHGLATATALQTVDDNVDAILVDTGTTLDTLIKDIPTTAEFEARTLAAANYFDPSTDTVATVTNLTNLPTMPADWVTASGLKADAVAEIQSGLATTAHVQEVEDKIDTLDTVADGIATTLASPDNFKADVSDLALESTLTAIKGAGWTSNDNLRQILYGIDSTYGLVEDGGRLDLLIDAIKAKTDQLTFTVANKVDATTTTDTSSIAGDVWSHATRTLTNQGVEATYPAEGDPLIIYRDTTVTISLTGLGDSTGDAGTKIFFTAKENLEDADTSSILQLVCTRADPITDPDTDDLLYVNKVAPTAATEGTFVFADHTDGTAVVTVAASAAAYLPIYAATPLYWDVKMVTAAGVSTILSTGSMYIYGTPTRTIA